MSLYDDMRWGMDELWTSQLRFVGLMLLGWGVWVVMHDSIQTQPFFKGVQYMSSGMWGGWAISGALAARVLAVNQRLLHLSAALLTLSWGAVACLYAGIDVSSTGTMMYSGMTLYAAWLLAQLLSWR